MRQRRRFSDEFKTRVAIGCHHGRKDTPGVCRGVSSSLRFDHRIEEALLENAVKICERKNTQVKELEQI